jgi:predicted nuclease with TOPRIM domain
MKPTDSNIAAGTYPAAFRIQAAAVVAQQTVLEEFEVRLNEQRLALEHRERQLAAHFDEKRRQMLELQQQLSESREQLRKERAEHAARLAAEYGKLTDDRARFDAELKRLHETRKRFVRQCQTRWSAERRAAQKRSHELAHEADQLRRGRLEFDRIRQQHLDTATSEKRRLHEAWKKLAAEKSRLREARRRVEQEFERREKRLGMAVGVAKRVADQHDQLVKRVESLRHEETGLETRIANARRRLAELEVKRATLDPDSPTPVPAPPVLTPPDLRVHAGDPNENDLATRERNLTRQIAEVDDQRRHLAELYVRLGKAEEDLRKRQIDALAELEMMAKQLHEQEAALQRARDEHQETEKRLKHQAETVTRIKREGELARSEWMAQQIVAESDRERQRLELEAARALQSRREKAIGDLFKKLSERRRAESERWRGIMDAAIQSRRDWATHAADAQRRAAALREAQTALAEQALALEQARQDFLAHVDDPAAAAKRLERLRRRWEGLSSSAARALMRRQHELEKADAVLMARVEELMRREAELIDRDRELEARLADVDNRARIVEGDQADLEQTRATWQLERARLEQQLADLKQELDRIARLLIDDSTIPPTASAA